jgi:alkyl hydroperoxide reductase subunit AhpC
MRIGDTVPAFRATAICHDGIRYLRSEELKGTWSIISFLPRHGSLKEHCSMVDPSSLAESDVQVLFIQSEASPGAVRALTGTVLPHSMTLIDPLGLLHRRFGVSRTSNPKCRSFLIDPDGLLRFQLVHDLSTFGMSVLWDLVVATRSRDTTTV